MFMIMSSIMIQFTMCVFEEKSVVLLNFHAFYQNHVKPSTRDSRRENRDHAFSRSL